MLPIKMSDLAYNEFKNMLDSNNINSNILRVYLEGSGWGGPSFNIVLDEQKENDLVSPIKDLVFLVEKSLYEEFGGFTLKCSEENGLNGFSVEPKIQPESSGCDSCSTCS